MESVFICNILYMGCISSVLISRKIDSCFPGDAAHTQHTSNPSRPKFGLENQYQHENAGLRSILDDLTKAHGM